MPPLPAILAGSAKYFHVWKQDLCTCSNTEPLAVVQPQLIFQRYLTAFATEFPRKIIGIARVYRDYWGENVCHLLIDLDAIVLS